MANDQHLKILKQGVYTWNRWRENDASLKPDISGVDLSGAHLAGALLMDVNFRKTNLEGSNLRGAECPRADFWNANLKNADLSKANLRLASFGDANLQYADLSGSHLAKAYLSGANLSRAKLINTHLDHADLSGAILHWANLSNADLYAANLMDTDLRRGQLYNTKLVIANMLRTDLRGTVLSGCHVHGASVWKVKVDRDTVQTNIIITDISEPSITTDDLEVAQFIHLLLNNERIRQVIDTITSKVVLILGRFTEERKAVLNAIREALRQHGYVSIVFDFERPTDRDFTETIMTLAGMCLFIIADITNPKSSPLELQATIPNYMVPFVPIIQEGEQPFAMFKDLRGKFDWVLDPLAYDSASHLIRGLAKAVIQPALKKHDELLAKKAEELRIRHIRDYLADI